MHFVELVVEGVRGFKEQARAPLGTSYSILKPSAQAPPELAGLSTAVLHSDGRGGDMGYVAPGQESGKVTLTVLGNDQNTYRLVRELGRGSVLQQLNPMNQQYELLSEDLTEIGQVLRAQVGLPSKKIFEGLFTLTLQHFPTRKSAPQSPAAAPAAKPGLPSRSGLSGKHSVEPAKDVPAAQAKVAELEKELALSREVAALQSRVDEVSSELFEVERKLQTTQALKAKLAQAEEAWAKAPSVESLNLAPDILSRVERFPALLAKRDQSFARLEEESRAGDGTARSIESLTSNRYFWACLAAGVLLFSTGLVLTGSARYLAVLDIPSFGMAAYLALRHVDDLRESQRASRRDVRLASREKKIHEEFEVESQYIKSAMTALGVQSPAEIVEALTQKPKLGSQVGELRKQLAQMEQAAEYRAALAGEQELKKEQDSLNAQLSEKGTYVRDQGEVEREIGRVKQSIALALEKPSGASAPASDAGPTAAPRLDDPFPSLVALAADLTGADSAAAASLLCDRCSQYFAALTEHRYTGLELDKEFKAMVTAGGQRLPATSIPPDELDLLYLAGRLALVEKCAGKHKVPLLIDDLGAAFDDVRQLFFGRMLKRLGTMTQVIQVSSQAALAPLAEAVVEV